MSLPENVLNAVEKVALKDDGTKPSLPANVLNAVEKVALKDEGP